MNGDFDPSNPYSSPDPSNSSPYSADDQYKRAAVTSKVMVPAIFLIVVGSLGIAASIFNVGYALVAEPPAVDPNAPEFVRQFQQGATGVFPALLHTMFTVVNGVIIFGAVQMLKIRSWAWAMAASIVAMVNFGTCCCVLGLPAGIWSIIVLANQDVKDVFSWPAQW
jgi:hypothetical protein